MKQFYALLLALVMPLCVTSAPNPYFNGATGQKNETFDQARARFKLMTVRQINNVDMCTLTKVQLEAFKDLAATIFRCEIASSGCFSQANRRKYEVMYQKIGESDLCQSELSQIKLCQSGLCEQK